MKVEGILRSKGAKVVTVRPDASLASLVKKLREQQIGAVVVTEDGRSVLGIISERDVVRGLAEHGPRILEMAVSDLMTRTVFSCASDDTVKHLMSEMTRKRIRHLPVLADGVLCGIVTIGDVVKNRLDELEMETNVLRDAYIARS
jgi:CBS domain-containing protein